jgi:ribulose 1,5-bisphosphate carboxylase large subunit-like protein
VARQKAFVETIEQSVDALSMEKVVKLFSTAFEQICAMKEVDKLVLERFRIIFQAAKDYGPLLAHYEKWDKIEGQIE